jgi:hypothetical protein
VEGNAQRLLEGARVARENLTEAGAAQPEAAPVGPPAGSDLPSVPPAFLESTRGLTLVYPMIGVIGHDAVESFRAALDEAATRKARAVVMVVDSPTGAPWTACEIGRLIGDHPDLRFSAYVDGDGALDAASPIPLCCDEILMARGARIRAEEPTLGPTRAGPALEKGLAVLKASWRAYAERRGRSGILADALIDHSFAVWEVPQGSARVFLRGTDDDRPAHGRLLRRQGEPLSLDAEACTRLGLGRSVASAAEASVLLGFREDFTRNAAYDAALRFARERSSVYSARLAWAQRSIAEVQAAADQLLAEVPDDTAPGQAVERLRHSVAAAGNALTLVDELVEQKRQEALPGVDIEPAAQAVEELHNWLQGVRDAYEQIAPAANAAPAM